MTLRLAVGWKESVQAGDWVLPGEPVFAESKAFELLSRDLRRYVRDEIAGRSFLIAGHRGAGKTTTVVEAVRRVHDDLLRSSANPQGQLGRRLRLQRPLIVKLVGQSLVSPPPRQREIERQQGATKTTGQAGKTGDAEQGRQAADDKAAADCGEQPADPCQAKKKKKNADHAEHALVHITIALYRAFAAEIALCFARHAERYATRDRNDRLELASQLALELDGTPEPALLRGYWNKLKRLQPGVLWPLITDQTMGRMGIQGQGMKEIVAIAAAAQAFEVCSGAVTYTVTSQEQASDERKLESGVDYKDLINRVGALGAGALAGSVTGVSEGAPAGVGAGLLVWLVSSITLNWTVTRQRKSLRSLDYTFLRDRSIETLDRDLPLVIERIRDAGLAPVFVIDELDKLPHASEKIKRIIDRLKHLVSDYGFFCFLTDRGYFDEIEGKVSDGSYPTEHTYFSQRVLVLNRPADLFKYIESLLRTTDSTEAEIQAIAIFAYAVIFRSRLNFTDLGRELARFIKKEDRTAVMEEDGLSLTETEIALSGELKLAATIQLAIEQVLHETQMAVRFVTDLAFEQLAIDVLYYVGRCWEQHLEKTVDIDKVAIKEDLLERMTSRTPDDVEDEDCDCAAARPPPSPPDPDAPPPISGPDLDELAGLAKRLVGYLGDFAKLQAALRERKDIPKGHADIVVVEKTRLMRRADDGKPNHFSFTLDQLGDPWPEGAAEPLQAATAADGAPEAERPLALLEEIEALLNTAGVGIDSLVSGRVLPATVSDGLLKTTMQDLAAWEKDRSPQEQLKRGSEGRAVFSQVLRSHGGRLADALVLLTQLSRYDQQASPPAILDRISRYFVLDTRRIRPEGWPRPRRNFGIHGETRSVKHFHRWLAGLPKRLEEQPDPLERVDMTASWPTWRDHVVGYLCRSQPPTAPLRYLDLAMAAGRVAPGRLFRASLGEMDVVDWSQAALCALPTEKEGLEGPPWLLFAALKALDFDRGALADLPRELTMRWPLPASVEDASAVEELVRAARERPPGILHVHHDDPPIARPVEIPRSRPMMAVGLAALDSYMTSLNWLADHGLIGGGTDETD